MKSHERQKTREGILFLRSPKGGGNNRDTYENWKMEGGQKTLVREYSKSFDVKPFEIKGELGARNAKLKLRMAEDEEEGEYP